MICKKNILLLLAAVLFSGCNLIINSFIERDPDFNMMTGSMTAIDNNTLVFRYNKELVVFEHQNGRWRYHSRFSVARLMHSKEISSIAVKGNIIAVGVKGLAYRNIKGTVGIYQRNLKNDGWGLLKVLRDPEPLPTPPNAIKDSLFGTHVAVTENHVVATFTGHYKDDAGLYLYDCRSKTGIVLHMGEPTVIPFKDRSAETGIAPDEVSLYYYNRYISGNGTTALRTAFLDEADALTNANAMERTAAFEHKGKWNAVDRGRVSDYTSYLDPEQIHRSIGNFRGNIEGLLIATVYSGVYVFEQNADGLWELSKNYGLAEHLKGSGRELKSVYKAVFATGAKETVALTANFDENLYKHRIGIHRKSEPGWEMTDEIIPEDLPGIRTISYDMPIVISNDLIVVGMERPPYHFFDGKPRGSRGDILIPLMRSILMDPIWDTAKLNRYPGRVCIYRLLPEKGYVLEDIIVRDRDEKGRLYFKSAIY